MNATVVGGGLAGSEAAWALAERGVRVTLHEMRPIVPTPAHRTDRLAELAIRPGFCVVGKRGPLGEAAERGKQDLPERTRAMQRGGSAGLGPIRSGLDRSHASASRTSC